MKRIFPLILGVVVLILVGIYSFNQTSLDVPQDVVEIVRTPAPTNTSPLEVKEVTSINIPIENSVLKKKLSEVLTSLPSNQDLQKLSSEEIHHTPEMVLEAGRQIGKILDQAEKDPTIRPEVMKFLLSCAESSEAVTVVRALCYKNVLSKVPSWDIFVPVADLKVPASVQSLSSSAP